MPAREATLEAPYPATRLISNCTASSPGGVNSRSRAPVNSTRSAHRSKQAVAPGQGCGETLGLSQGSRFGARSVALPGSAGLRPASPVHRRTAPCKGERHSLSGCGPEARAPREEVCVLMFVASDLDRLDRERSSLPRNGTSRAARIRSITTAASPPCTGTPSAVPRPPTERSRASRSRVSSRRRPSSARRR